MPTDLAILQALHHQAVAPVPLRLLAERCGLPPERMALRMRSLVSLGYVDCVRGAQDDAYVLGPVIGTWPRPVQLDPTEESAQGPNLGRLALVFGGSGTPLVGPPAVYTQVNAPAAPEGARLLGA